MEDEPINFVLVNGVSSEELRRQLEGEFRWLKYYHGRPILPPGAEIHIVDLHTRRIEPDIEDEP